MKIEVANLLFKSNQSLDNVVDASAGGSKFSLLINRDNGKENKQHTWEEIEQFVDKNPIMSVHEDLYSDNKHHLLFDVSEVAEVPNYVPLIDGENVSQFVPAELGSDFITTMKVQPEIQYAQIDFSQENKNEVFYIAEEALNINLSEDKIAYVPVGLDITDQNDGLPNDIFAAFPQEDLKFNNGQLGWDDSDVGVRENYHPQNLVFQIDNTPIDRENNLEEEIDPEIVPAFEFKSGSLPDQPTVLSSQQMPVTLAVLSAEELNINETDGVNPNIFPNEPLLTSDQNGVKDSNASLNFTEVGKAQEEQVVAQVKNEHDHIEQIGSNLPFSTKAKDVREKNLEITDANQEQQSKAEQLLENDVQRAKAQLQHPANNLIFTEEDQFVNSQTSNPSQKVAPTEAPSLENFKLQNELPLQNFLPEPKVISSERNYIEFDFRSTLENVSKDNNLSLPDQLSISMREGLKLGKTDIKISLYPDALGAVDVKLEMLRASNGELETKTIKITVDEKTTLEALEKNSAILLSKISSIVNSESPTLEFQMRQGSSGQQDAAGQFAQGDNSDHNGQNSAKPKATQLKQNGQVDNKTEEGETARQLVNIIV